MIDIIPVMEIQSLHGFDVTGEFKQIKQDKETEVERLAAAFVEGGTWLAKQNNPTRQFEDIIRKAARINAVKLSEARQQFEEITTLGHTDASRAFNLMVGLAIFQISPQSFFMALPSQEGVVDWSKITFNPDKSLASEVLKKFNLNPMEKNLNKEILMQKFIKKEINKNIESLHYKLNRFYRS